MLATIPFSGFYQSIHDATIDCAVESPSCGKDNIRDALYGCCNFQHTYEQYASRYAEHFLSAIRAPGKFDELIRPKYYNFTTDRIVVRLSEQWACGLVKYMKRRPELDAMAKDWFTSRPGFISHYPNDWRKWPEDVGRWDLNHMGCTLAAFCQLHRSEVLESFDADFTEELSGNGHLENWLLYRAPRAQRWASIAHYLQQREER